MALCTFTRGSQALICRSRAHQAVCFLGFLPNCCPLNEGARLEGQPRPRRFSFFHILASLLHVCENILSTPSRIYPSPTCACCIVASPSLSAAKQQQ